MGYAMIVKCHAETAFNVGPYYDLGLVFKSIDEALGYGLSHNAKDAVEGAKRFIEGFGNPYGLGILPNQQKTKMDFGRISSWLEFASQVVSENTESIAGSFGVLELRRIRHRYLSQELRDCPRCATLLRIEEAIEADQEGKHVVKCKGCGADGRFPTLADEHSPWFVSPKTGEGGPIQTGKADLRTTPDGSFTYDVGLSFAGEDRPTAEKLSQLLKQQGVTVFIDSDCEDELWGRNLHEILEEKYKQCKYFVPIISKWYTEKAYTRHEIRTAVSITLMSSRADFILPIRLDDTQVPGLPDNVSSVDLRQRDISSVVALLQRKLSKGDGL